MCEYIQSMAPSDAAEELHGQGAMSRPKKEQRGCARGQSRVRGAHF